MFSSFSTLKLKVDFNPTVDNFIFRLHYRYTYMFFMACVILATLYDWIGKSIDCLINSDNDSLQNVVNSWCFIMGTFTVDRHHEGRVGKDVPHPGVGPHDETDEITIHSYYQWVPFILFFQGVMFYVPHWIWKGLEGGLFRNIIMDLSIRDYLGNNLINYEKRNERYYKLAIYIKDHLHTHRMWAFKFFVCEFLNLSVTVATFLFTNWFLGGEFTKYGSNVFKVLQEDPEDRSDPMAMVFPRMAKCTFQQFGPSGTIQVKDAMCLIATNIVNEKIYLFIWVWLIFLMAITSAWLIFRMFTILISQIRYILIKNKASRALPYEIKVVMDSCCVSDWFLLYNLGRNMDKTVFSEFVRFLSHELDSGRAGETDSLVIPMKRMSTISSMS